MKKLIYTLLLLSFLIACSSDDEDKKQTTSTSLEPNKGDDITVQDVVGMYEPYRVYFDNSKDNAFFEHKQLITFNGDGTGYDFTYDKDHEAFSWSISKNIISFKHSKYGYVKAWKSNDRISFRSIYAVYNEFTSIAIFEYKKMLD